MTKKREKNSIPILHPITRLIVGGAQENTMYTAVMLNKDRYQVDIVSGPQTGSEGSLIEETRQRGASLIILPELVREINPWKDFLATWKLCRMMKAGQYIIVHTHSSKAGILGRLAARLAGVPIIVHTVHGWSFHDHMNARLRWVYVMMEKLAASISDMMIVVTERDIQKGLNEGIGRPDLYRLIRSAIPLADFDPERVDRTTIRQELGIPLNVPVLGNVGRFSPQKNPLDWVRVAAKVAQAIPACHFLLVGDGPLRGEVERQLKTDGLENHFILTGIRRDIPRMMSAMDVFLLTSLWEGLPRVIPQAMSMGVPVVANRADGTIEAIHQGETGYLSDPGNLDEMTEYCIKLLSEKEYRKEISRKGQIFAKNEFGLKHMISQIEELYENLLAKQCL